jgi:hypothetical protein
MLCCYVGSAGCATSQQKYWRTLPGHLMTQQGTAASQAAVVPPAKAAAAQAAAAAAGVMHWAGTPCAACLAARRGSKTNARSRWRLLPSASGGAAWCSRMQMPRACHQRECRGTCREGRQWLVWGRECRFVRHTDALLWRGRAWGALGCSLHDLTAAVAPHLPLCAHAGNGMPIFSI